MILDECLCNDKHIPTKQLFDLTHHIYFPKENLVINLSNKIIDIIIGWLERASDSRVDSTDKIRMYDTAIKSVTTSQRWWILFVEKLGCGIVWSISQHKAIHLQPCAIPTKFPRLQLKQYSMQFAINVFFQGVQVLIMDVSVVQIKFDQDLWDWNWRC